MHFWNISKDLFWILVLLVLFTGCNSSSSTPSTPKGKLFIIGGGQKPESMVQQMIDESGIANGGYGVVLPMASSVPDTSGWYGMQQFNHLGITNVFSYNFADSLQNVEAKTDSVRNATLIYIPGGVQSRFMEVIEKNPGIKMALEEAYRSGALIAGTSAGAAVMSQIMITGDQRKYPEYTSTFYHLENDNIVTDEGLGLVKKIIVDQHFIKRARNNRLLTAVMEYPDHIGIGIDESTAIIVHGKELKVVGESQVIVYQNLSGRTESKNGKLSAQNIQIDIYLPGDTFTLPL